MKVRQAAIDALKTHDFVFLHIEANDKRDMRRRV